MASSRPDNPNELETLLKRGRELEDQGNYGEAVRYYRAAMARLPKEDPLRERLETTVDFLEQGREPGRPGEPDDRNPRMPPDYTGGVMHTGPGTEIPASFKDEEVRTEYTEQVAAPGIPWWLWTVAALGVLVACGLIVLSAYLYLQSSSVPIPRLNNLAPTPLGLGAAPAAAPSVIPTAPPAGSPPGTNSPTARPGNGAQPRILFQDTFNQGQLDPLKWTYENRQGTLVDLSHGSMRIFSGAKHNAYVYTQSNPFPATGNLQMDVRFRYLREGTCGSPVVMASFVLPAGLSQIDTNKQSQAAEATGVSVWFWHNVIYYRSGSTREDISIADLGQSFHQATVRYIGNKYQILLDGNPLYTSPATSARPQAIWFGLPFNLENTCEWDTLEVSQVTVGSLP
jgi:hypothetical protein